jgi:hypothetical protein
MISIRSITLVLSGLALLALSACHKTEQPDPVPVPQDTMMVRQLTAGSQDFISYTYTADKAVETYVSQWQHNPEGDLTRIETQYSYENGRLTRWTNTAGYAKFTLSAKQAIKAEIYRPDETLVATHFFTYYDDGKLREAVEVIPDNLVDEVVQSRFQYSYGIDGNLNKLEYAIQYKNVPGFQTSYIETYEVYDGRINPEPTAVMGYFLPGVRLFAQNPRQIQVTRPGSNDVEIWRMQYTYNSQGYPVTKVRQVELNGVLKPSIQFTYSY